MIYLPGLAETVHLFKDMQMTCLLAVGKFTNTVSGLTQWVLLTVEIWCSEIRLSVNPDKIGLLNLPVKENSRGTLNHNSWGLN